VQPALPGVARGAGPLGRPAGGGRGAGQGQGVREGTPPPPSGGDRGGEPVPGAAGAARWGGPARQRRGRGPGGGHRGGAEGDGGGGLPARAPRRCHRPLLEARAFRERPRPGFVSGRWWTAVEGDGRRTLIKEWNE